MTYDPVTWQSILTITAGFGAAFLVILWFSLIVWTWRDAGRRMNDRLTRLLATLIVALLFVAGLLIYLVLRPPRTQEEEFQRSLEEEALLQSIEDNALCPGCNRRVHEDWIACPSCYTLLKKNCHHCSKAIELSWKLCPYCGTLAPEFQRANMVGEKGFTMLSGDEDGSAARQRGK